MNALRNFRIYFFRGLAALLPTVLTIWLFVQFYLFVQDNVSSHINRAFVRALVTVSSSYPHVSDEELKNYAKTEYPELADEPNAVAKKIADPKFITKARVKKASKFWVQGQGQITGFFIALIGVIFLGAFLASFLGKALWRAFERALMKAPLVKKVYPYIKQITDFFLTRQKLSFSKVVAFEYPRKGIWTLGMVTGAGLNKVGKDNGKEYLTIFVPTSPTPFTGYVILVPEEDTMDLNISIEEALRFTVSGGVIPPESLQTSPSSKAATKLAEESKITENK